jgi:hypothetical protein
MQIYSVSPEKQKPPLLGDGFYKRNEIKQTELARKRATQQMYPQTI